AGIGAVGEAVDRQAWERHGVLDARLLERDLAHAPDHVFRSIEGRGIRQLGEADEILLVLSRHEAAGYGLEEPERQPHESEIDTQHHRLARDNTAYTAAVGTSAEAEYGVEAPEQPAERHIHGADQKVLGRVTRLQEQGGQCWRQSERVDGRDNGRDGDRQRELAVELPCQPADEGERGEDRNQLNSDRDEGP